MSETTEGTPPPEPTEEPAGAPAPEAPPEPQEEADPLQRRFSRLTARLSNVSRQRDEMAARLQALEAAQQQPAPQQQPPQPIDPQTAHIIQQEALRLNNATRLDERMRDFHAQGGNVYPDWEDRCRNLMAMGADPQIAELLIELPEGHKVAASLADEPEELERIAAIRTERGRAIALGQYAAKLDAKPAAVRQTSRAPKPPTPVSARTTPQFSEYTADAQALVKHYAKQAMESRMQGQRGGKP